MNGENVNGQVKCPSCGSTNITHSINAGMLICNTCRREFAPEKYVNTEQNINNLNTVNVATGAADIDNTASGVITLKCQSCGAEVVIDSSKSYSARCHWCRSRLSINCQIPNGAVPDVVLPFAITKQDAQKEIELFVKKRKFFANNNFKKEFTAENILGVFFPYLVVDVNMHVSMSGNGEHEIRRYLVDVGNDRKETRYDAEVYYVKRDFDIAIEGLTVESSKDKLQNSSKNITNNVINAILPFDIENAVKWNASYLVDYTSEKRDVNIHEVKPLVNVQSADIARFSCNDTLKFYDRGVRWDSENFDLKGEQWKSAYLPVWLYSYQQVKSSGNVLHYVAVNARTKEIMGSVPINMPKLIGVSCIVEFIGLLMMLFLDWKYDFLFLALGIIFYYMMYARYRNKNARHHHETETKNTKSNMVTLDNYLNTERGLRFSTMTGANNKTVRGSTIDKKNALMQKAEGSSAEAFIQEKVDVHDQKVENEFRGQNGQ